VDIEEFQTVVIPVNMDSLSQKSKKFSNIMFVFDNLFPYGGINDSLMRRGN
jgi:hypothetical protein